MCHLRVARPTQTGLSDPLTYYICYILCYIILYYLLFTNAAPGGAAACWVSAAEEFLCPEQGVAPVPRGSSWFFGGGKYLLSVLAG